MEQGASNTVNTPVVDMSTPQASSPVEANPPVKDNAVFTNKPKKNKGMILGMVLLGFLAVGGIGFGVWAMMDGNAQKEQLNSQISVLKEQNDKLAVQQLSPSENNSEVVDTNKISNSFARNLIDPYLGEFTYINDIFDHDFNENTKFFIAYKSLSDTDVSELGVSGDVSAYIPYYVINRRYKYLFGNDKDLPKEQFEDGYINFVYANQEVGVADRFNMKRSGGGGTGSTLFSVIKDAYYENGKIVVEVYHDRVVICGINDSSYCLDVDDDKPRYAGYYTVSNPQIEQLILNNEDRVPVYKMIFSEGDSHYVLDSIEKE